MNNENKKYLSDFAKFHNLSDDEVKKYQNKILLNESENRLFYRNIEEVLSPISKINHPVSVMSNPYIMEILGSKASKIVVDPSVLRNSNAKHNKGNDEHTQGHEIMKNEFKKIPQSIREPIMVLKGNANNPNSVVCITEMQNVRKHNVIAAISLDRNRNESKISFIASLYSKEKDLGGNIRINKIGNYIKTHAGEIIAVDIKKAQSLCNGMGVQFPRLNIGIPCFDNSIAYTTENVKPLTKELLDKIITEGAEKPMNEQNINLSNIDPAAAEIIKQLQAQLQQQSAENAALKNEMAEVKSEVSEIKAENAALKTEVDELKAEVREQGSRIDALESSAEIVKAFTAAMSETKSFEQTMAEVQSVAKQLTGCEKAEFLCFDNNENKFFSSEDGKTRNWQESTEQLGTALKSTEIMFADDNRTKAFIPVAGNDGKQIGVLVADKADGFTENDLKDFSIGGDIMNTIDLAIKKEQNHLTAVTDNLTHLKNRDGLAEYQKTTIVPNAENKTPVNIIMCDIDHFKSINDTYGHDAGDIILKNVAKVLSEHTRSGSDCAFRMGGEEMVCVLNCSPTDAIAAAERLRKAVEDTVHTVMHNGEPTEVKVTISVGIHEMQTDKKITPENVAQIFDAEFKQSDNAVYAAKETGRNRVVSADTDTMKDYLLSRAAEAVIEANNLPETVNEVKENILKDFSMDEINDHLLAADTPLADRVCEQIAEFTAANDYFAEKSGGAIEADNETVEYITDYMSDENRAAFESAVSESNAQTPQEKLDIIKEKFPDDYEKAEASNSKEQCEAEFEEMCANMNELKETIQDAVQKTAEISQQRNKGGDAI